VLAQYHKLRGEKGSYRGLASTTERNANAIVVTFEQTMMAIVLKRVFGGRAKFVGMKRGYSLI
jgi:hypothetical protein